MKYLDTDTLRSIDPQAFRDEHPYPWINPSGFLTADGYEALLADMPDLRIFERSFGVERKYGQQSHGRFVLEYTDGIAIPEPWQSFIDELRSDVYRDLIRSLLDYRHIRLRFHWHYTPKGCSVSPHCDSRSKLGSHIFYMNTWKDWDPSWGGETLILDDNGRFPAQSSPKFEEFDDEIVARTMDNHSLIFGRRGNSWHGVRVIRCPENAFRKVFIVVFEDVNPRKYFVKRVRRLLKGQPLVSDKERAMY